MRDERRVQDTEIAPTVSSEKAGAFSGVSLVITAVKILAVIVGVSTLILTPEYPVASALFAAGILAGLIYLSGSIMFQLWSAYFLGITVFTHLRSLADQTMISTKYEYVIDIDAFLFFGHVPTVWLQNRYFEFGNYTWFDQFMVGIHLSYFLIPYAMALGLAFLSREFFARYVLGVVATFYLGLVIYFLIPTSPPWLSSHLGYLPEVTRIVQVIGTEVSPEAYQQGYRVAGANDVAAMPSLHFAITVVIMLAHWRFNWIFRSIFITYTLLMGLALVYLAEHYVIDLIAGFAVAALGWKLAQWFYDRVIQHRNPQASTPPTHEDGSLNAG
jgi:membrane-associated phospholipid phosphatase